MVGEGAIGMHAPGFNVFGKNVQNNSFASPTLGLVPLWEILDPPLMTVSM